MKHLLSLLPSSFLALVATLAAFADAEMSFVTAEGRLAGAYQDNVDAAFVCLVLERAGKFNYAFIKTNDTASVLKGLQPLVGRHVTVSGRERIPHALNRAVTKRQIMIQSLADIRIASGATGDPFDAPPIDKNPPRLDELADPTPRRTVGTVTAKWQNKVMLQTARGESLIAELRDGTDLPAIGESVDTAAKMIRSCRTDLRRCLWDLRSDVLDETDFAEAIRKTVAPVAGSASVDVRFARPRAAIRDSTAHGVLNAVRELVANAVQHMALANSSNSGMSSVSAAPTSTAAANAGFRGSRTVLGIEKRFASSSARESPNTFITRPQSGHFR